ncbi:MAG: alpha/beta hydrolase-fold protein [Dokdonella sp.]
MPPHERLRLNSTVMHETRPINVYLPPRYDAATGARYPALYLPDGGDLEDFPHVANAADRLIWQGVLRPFVIVSVENTDRRRDVTAPRRMPET